MTTLHVVSLPWTETTREYITCAYTQKIVKFGAMMADSPYRVIIYSGAENEAVCDEHVPLLQPWEREQWFGPHNQNTVWEHVTWDAGAKPWMKMNARATMEILDRAAPHDLVALVAGHAQQPILPGLADVLGCEPFVGYYGFASDFCAFESHAWRHHVYGTHNIQDGRWFDTVIPNYFDPEEFFLDDKDDYLLYVGRVTVRKGVQVASDLAKAAGMRLIVAGGGVREVRQLPGGGVHLSADGCEFGGSHVAYLGPVNSDERSALMARAAALLAPTLYLEPFGGVAVEAMLSGTPAVTSDWGAFTETVRPRLSGYRFSTLQEGVRAVRDALELRPEKIREYAISRYSLTAVRPQFERWFDNLSSLWEAGWYNLPQEVSV